MVSPEETQEESSSSSNNADDPTDPHPILPLNKVSSRTFSVPLPPPETGALPKEPGLTRQSLEKLAIHNVMDASGTGGPGDDHSKRASASTTGDMTPSTESSSSGLASDWTGPSTRPPSKPTSRAPSVNEGKRPEPPAPPEPQPALAPKMSETEKPSDGAQHLQAPPQRPHSQPSSKTPSLHEHEKHEHEKHEHEKHKFNLKDLLAQGPKLVRRSSARSVGSSKKSDSDGERRSECESLSKKYGVCTKIPIGKGATSVVRLAHKWDRSEEKLYAIKVR
jgi:protein-serine/threonine kinase